MPKTFTVVLTLALTATIDNEGCYLEHTNGQRADFIWATNTLRVFEGGRLVESNDEDLISWAGAAQAKVERENNYSDAQWNAWYDG